MKAYDVIVVGAGHAGAEAAWAAARHGQVREGLPDLVRPHLGGVPLALEKDEAFNPVRVSLLGAEAEVTQARDGAHPI